MTDHHDSAHHDGDRREGTERPEGTDRHDDIGKLAELIADFPIAMIATHDADHRILAQPFAMQHQRHAFDGDLWFLIAADSSTAQRVDAHQAVDVILSSNDSWVSLTGLAEVVSEQRYIDEMWDASAEAWFPDGREDPGIRALLVHADGAEYWDSPGGRVATVLSFVKSKVSGRPIDIDTEKVDL